ncbi:PX domain-containing protein EREL1 isoform X3 [Malania oleifera]|uniref:PX domain-containing protein EREL1 isoform X3 n=1 Tax=Malania oleifera TaxID=397392 RepID=UPI0025ADA7AB|nr:PX domain-containing protein EREL1 isoform X3 [Malania oleifera]
MTLQCLSMPRFYRVQIGVQSPEGITTIRGVLRRFNDFLKLFSDLKKAFPKKNLPAPPPKGLLRMKSRALLEERRCSLEQWMSKLLSDIDVSRSISVASFLELEAAARSCMCFPTASTFQDVDQQTSEGSPASGSGTTSSLELHPNSSLSLIAGSSSITSDFGSDTAYETSELETPRLGKDTNSEVGTDDLVLDEDLSSPIEKLVKYGLSNIDEGLFMGQTILEQLEGFPGHKVHARQLNNFARRDIDNGIVSKSKVLSDPEHGKIIGHVRKLSTESVGSDTSSLKGSETSNSGNLNSFGDGSLDFPGGAEVSRNMETVSNSDWQFVGNTQVVLPLDQRHKMNRVLMTMQRRLITAKTDMEDLIARLNQEIAVKDYLMTKVKDLEVELDTTRQKSKENLQQAILVERERVTQMQWDMEELRRKSLEMELKLNSEKDQKVHAESTQEVLTVHEKQVLLQELEDTKEQLKNALKRREELEVKSKSDIKVLVKEVKSLRRTQADMKQELSQSLKEKTEAEKLLREETERREHAKSARRKLLHECRIFQNQLDECNINILAEEGDKFFKDSSPPSEVFDLLTTSDNRIGYLLAEAQLIAAEDEHSQPSVQGNENSSPSGKFCEFDGDTSITDEEEVVVLRKLLKDIFIDNATLRKKVNSVIRGALKMEAAKKEDDRAPSIETVPNKFLQR